MVPDPAVRPLARGDYDVGRRRSEPSPVHGSHRSVWHDVGYRDRRFLHWSRLCRRLLPTFGQRDHDRSDRPQEHYLFRPDICRLSLARTRWLRQGM